MSARFAPSVGSWSRAVGELTVRQEVVNAALSSVKESSGGLGATVPRPDDWDAPGSTKEDLLTERQHNDMADLLFAVLLIGVFLMLALTLRGLERM